MPSNKPTLKEVLEADEFELPVGTTINGVFHKTAKLTEMDGYVEEAIAEKNVRQNYAKVVTEALHGVVERIGSVEKKNIDRGVIKSLTAPDRDFLMLMNYKVTMGDNIEWTGVCPKCEAKMDMNVDVDSIPITYLAHDEKKEWTFELPRGVKNDEGTYCKEMTISLPNGYAQEKVFPQYFINESTAMSVMLSFITEGIKGYGHCSPDTFKGMSKRDRKFIAQQMAKQEIGPDLSPQAICPSCGHEHKQPIPPTTLLGE
ncbi:hypothetical protein F400_gp090 [Bacillus phage BCD7]|uniref:Uncharacterized protein n=1 Tax=Bacillus phage BCD7 TaxID=1136534 RepID=J9PUD8_9CAUD|nr:hypothetical protein F400_gp090 [Bacillus phage BCD7]AEZ50537.1 hypothetical protein BCD7_0090 [Bacillus phage BCD7]